MAEPLTTEERATAAAEVREIRAKLEGLVEELGTIREEVSAAEPEHLDDASRERMEAMFEEFTDAQAVEHLLAIHKLVELHSIGKATLLAEAEAHALALTLLRVAPEALGDGLALYMEHSEDEERSDGDELEPEDA